MIYSNLIAMFDCGVNDEDLDAGDFPLPPWLKHRTCASKWARFRCKLSNSNRNRAARPRLKKWKAQPIKSYQIGQSPNEVNLVNLMP